MTSYANPDRLMETEALASRLDDESLAVIEVDEDTTAYDKDHIPGAVGLDWRHELHATPRRGVLHAGANESQRAERHDRTFAAKQQMQHHRKPGQRQGEQSPGE